MMERLRPFCAIFRALFADTLIATPDVRARESIQKLDDVLSQRSRNLAESTQRIAREL